MKKSVKPDYTATSHTLGGYAKDLPKPWKLMFDKDSPLKRRVSITIHRYYGIGQHYWVNIHEEDNAIWDAKEKTWRTPWGKTKNGKDDWGIQKLLNGRLLTRQCLSIASAKSYVRHILSRFFPETAYMIPSGWEQDFEEEGQPGGTYFYPNHD